MRSALAKGRQGVRISRAMRFSKRAFSSTCAAAGLAAGMMWLTATCQAGEFSLGAAGARYGSGGNASSWDFNEAEVFADWNLPWRWDLGRDLYLQTRLDSSAGWLGDHGANAGIFTLGPGLRLGRKHFPLTVELGANLAVLTDKQFATKDLGSLVQCTSYAGLSADLGRHFRVGYRYQHMSNGGLSIHNPGLNLHMFSLSYVF